MSLALLRRQLEAVVPAAPSAQAIAVGIPALEAALGGGLPTGRLTALVTEGAGAATLLRQVAASALGAGHAVAVVDATRTLHPRDWAPLAAGARAARLRVIRATPARGAWCADVLLRSGAFRLVVLDGAPPIAPAVAVRLAGLARDTDTALVVAGPPGTLKAGVGVRVVVGRPVARGQAGRWSAPGRLAGLPPLRLLIAKGGAPVAIEVERAFGVASRLCAHPEVPDRRGVGSAEPGAVQPRRPRPSGQSRRRARR